MDLKRSLARLLLVLLACGQTVAPAQTPASPPPPSEQTEEAKEKKERAEALERKALALLDEVVGEARSLRVPENRVRVLTQAADLLWPRDEKRARALFRDVGVTLSATAGRPERDGERRQRRYWSVQALRQEFLQAVARRDPSLALELLAATRQPPPAEVAAAATRGGYRQADPELRLEQQLASQVAASDPKRALKMAEDALAKGLSYALVGLIHQLQAKDPEAAAAFAASVVKKLQGEDLSKNGEAEFVAANLLGMTGRRQTNAYLGAVGSPLGPSAKPLELDAQATRGLIEVVLTAALNNPDPNNSSLFQLQAMMPEVERLAPDRAPLLRRRVEERVKRLDPETRRRAEFEPLMQKDSPEAIIEAAAKAPADLRQTAYARAAWMALAKGDAEKARQIVNEHFKDSPERVELLAAINRQALMLALREGKIEEARRQVSQLRSKEERAAALARLAVLASKDNRKLALQLLEEAQLLMPARPKSQRQLLAQLQLARAFALVEPARAFEIVEAVVDRANEMIAAADVLDGFMPGPEIFRDGELVMHQGLGSFETIFNLYGRELAALARADFDRAASAAARFQRQEVRTMARLLIAQGLLSDRQPTGAPEGYHPGIEESFTVTEY